MNTIVTPHPAATVMLLREAPEDMEVFMIVRHEKSDVHAGALVFPGGRVDPEDYDLARDPGVCPMQMCADTPNGALRVAAVRETFEECGVLLARPRGEEALVSADRLREIEAAHRDAIMRGERTFGALLAAEDLVLAPETLVYFANWITPERRTKRFDVHFFLAPAPADQIAVHDGYEAVDSVWISPRTALERASEGAYQLRFPTQMNVQKLGRHASPAAAMDAARASHVVTVMTKHERSPEGKRYVRIPLEAGYGGDVFEVIESGDASG
jgi:8-oxo-dGTP pyrophosphatase MutT (NUDIX family)